MSPAPAATAAHDELLRRDVRFLGDMLGSVIRDLAGDDARALVDDVRQLARERRQGRHEAEATLAARIESLDEGQATIVARALSIFFDLANIAEDRQRIRVLRDRERMLHPEPLGESLAAAIRELKDLGAPADDVQRVLDRLAVELVFTAHPSEAKRRSIRAKLRRMRRSLEMFDTPDLLPRERSRHEADMRSELTLLWLTEFLRSTRPTVLDEVDRGLSIMPRLWEAVPQVHAALRRALADHYAGHAFRVPAFLSFGSWMGGDRDGNPFVTADVTEQTLVRLRQAAIDAHLAWCDRLHDLLTVSSLAADGGRALARRLAEVGRRWPDVAAAVEPIAEHETYRRWIRMIRLRLAASRLESPTVAPAAWAYRDGADLEADLEPLLDSLRCDHCLAEDSPARAWHDLVRTFGLHMTRLDVRQDSRAYREIMGDILAAAGVVADAASYDGLDDAGRARLLVESLGRVHALPEEKLGGLAIDSLRLFRVLHAASVRFGSRSLGGAVVSLTRCPADVLAVLWLWRWAQGRAAAAGEPVSEGDIAIVPLFEKIHDLAHAHETLAAILDVPAYRDHLRGRGDRQVVMVGYSDSTKDGGYFSACCGLQNAQSRLHAAAEARGVALTFFHGRGGSLGRGGGPAARGILSLPSETLDGSLRLTEQGEVLAERYDDPEIARRHLEQVTWATLVASSVRRSEPKPEWIGIAERMAEGSFAAYRELVDQPGFIGYFSQTTPIDEIETLPIASRPSRRRGERTLDDLRAIPWVFAWTQSRCMIPAWYGLGTALTDVKYADRRAWQAICDMYRQWPFFQATIDNATLALAKADMVIAQRYSELATDDDSRRRIWQRIAAERDRTRQAILDIVGGGELLATTPWFQRSIEARNPSIDPLNLIQIEFLRRRRAELEADPASSGDHHRGILRLCVQGIAAGMRTTG
ncbi:MAG: phosphoenolpyruvate carboxylase [Planctomycetes bacterium]|nr:phosphoenolpyruvate carboxylase [Planctomycetota bacterium]